MVPTLQNGSTLRSSGLEIVDPEASWRVVCDDHPVNTRETTAQGLQHLAVAVPLTVPFVPFTLDNQEDVAYNYTLTPPLAFNASWDTAVNGEIT